MYDLLKGAFARLLRVPTAPPEQPAGSYASVRVFRASPRFLTYKLLPFYFGLAFEVLAFGGGFLGVTFGHEQLGVGGTAAVVGSLALVAFFTLMGYFAIRLDYDLRYYILTDRSLRIREGSWLVKEMTLTHANVQNLSVSQGPLQRMLGIADVVIQTAGGGGGAAAHQGPGGSSHRAVLAGVEDAEAVRDLIRGHMKRARDDGGGLGDDARPRSAAKAVPAPPGAGWSPAVLAALREVAEAAQALREVAGGQRPGPSGVRLVPPGRTGDPQEGTP